MYSKESLYDLIGGEVVLHGFVEYLYDEMDTLPEVAHVRAMHSADLSRARNHLFMFLSGMFGGPALYVEAFGHPRLRRKHLHFEIGDEERDQWLLCAQKATDKPDITGDIGQEIMSELSVMANHLRNKDTIDHSSAVCINLDDQS